MDFLKFGAIDIGSNALRLLLCNVYEDDSGPVFKKAELFRFPLRLGEDSFLNGKISDETIGKLAHVMTAYKHLLEAYGVLDFRICATAAMREASNSKYVIDVVQKRSGLKIEVIDGRTEAELIFANHIEKILDPTQSYLYVDVGGGSTELTLFSNGKTLFSNSFNIGTIRMLHGMVDQDTWNGFKDAVLHISNLVVGEDLVAIGSGGNINKIFKMAGRKEDQYLAFKKIQSLYDEVSTLSYDERISKLKLNPDRADVIIPAFKIFLSVLKWSNIEKLIVPQVGLSDGIVHALYEQHMSTPQK
ncbi:MAG: exopolyphosphatase [Bacteroidota bacterium]